MIERTANIKIGYLGDSPKKGYYSLLPRDVGQATIIGAMRLADEKLKSETLSKEDRRQYEYQHALLWNSLSDNIKTMLCDLSELS